MEVSKLNALVKTVQIPETKKVENEPPKVTSDNKNAKILGYSMLGLAVLGAAGIAIHQRSKAKKVLTNALEAFKENGNKFEKGKAVLADGTGYTGILTKVNKNGDKIAIEYKDGVLIKSVKNGGEALEKNYLEKIYQYNENGKLSGITKIDNKSVKTVILEESKELALCIKELREIKQAETNTYLKNLESHLSKKPDVKLSPELIDNSLNPPYAPKKPGTWGGQNIKEYYQKLEEKEQKIKEDVKKLSEKYDPALVDKYIENLTSTTKSDELTQLSEYYKGLEQKEANIKANVKKLKEQMAKKPAITASPELLDKNAQQANPSDLKALEQMNNRLRKLEEKTALTTEKTTTTSEESGKVVTKNYLKNKKGKNILTNRETVMPDGSVKTVVHNTDGISEVVIKDAKGEILSSKKYDKKGNILEEYIKKTDKPDSPQPPKVLAEWYNNYLKLCKKYGIEPNDSSKEAWTQFKELAQREAVEIAAAQEKAILTKFTTTLKELISDKEFNQKIGGYLPEEQKKIQEFVSKFIKETSEVTATKEDLAAKIQELDIDTLKHQLKRLNKVISELSGLNGSTVQPMEINSKQFIEHMISIRKKGQSLEDSIATIEDAIYRKMSALQQQYQQQYQPQFAYA